MKRILAILIFLGMVLAADLTKLSDSSGALVGALKGALKDPLDVSAYIPGYGYVIALRGLFGGESQEKTLPQIKTLLLALSGTVQGLDSSDWLTVTYKADEYSVVVRIKPGKTDTLEVWVNGSKQ